MKVKIKKEIDKEILRSFGLVEVSEKTETIDGKEKKIHEEKYPEVGDEVELPDETLWRHGVYDNESFLKILGENFLNEKAEKEAAKEAIAEQKAGEEAEAQATKQDAKAKSKTKGGE